MASKTKRRPPKVRRTPDPRAQTPPPRHPRWWLYGVAGAAIAAVAAVVSVVAFTGGGAGGKKAAAGLPDTPDYHSLLVNPADPQKIVLGTHVGLYVSSDGGRHWQFDALSGNDAMNLAGPSGRTLWVAGHYVFKKSVDGGATWSDVLPSGLPTLDIHGFAVDPRNSQSLYAAVAGRGLYHSRDGGRSFSLASSRVGGNVMALAVLPKGRVLAGDMEQGLLESADGGASWKERLGVQVMGIAVSPGDRNKLLATGRGIALSTDGGRSWRSVLDLPGGAGPVAWSTSDPNIAYVVGFDRTFYRSVDAGENWQPVEVD
jgi:photosystem II stability/assembly factor-like uncharacterized protein